MSEQTQSAGTTPNTGTDATATGAQPPAEATQQQVAASAPVGQPPADTTQGTESATPPAATTASPEKYEFTAPDGTVFDTEVISEFSASAKELGLSQDAAQKLLDRMSPKVAERQAAALQARLAAVSAEWADQARADPEIKGDTVAAEKALAEFGTPELKQLLVQSGFKNHPEVIRLLHRVGKAMSEDGIVGGRPRDSGKDAKSFYPNTKMN